MLEKNSKKVYYDAHFHLSVCLDVNSFDIENEMSYKGCSCAHSISEWKNQNQFINNFKLDMRKSFGIHPQNPDISNVIFLESLIQKKEINAIGETGFDFFKDEFKKQKDIQEEVWNIQLELAIENNLPIIVHCRKGNEKLFEYSKKLKKIPSVLFHSFMGSSVEAKSLLKKDINCFFSFGKQIFNNNKKVLECVNELPLSTLLCETDAPFQYLKNESQTYCSEIKKVYDAFYNLKKEQFSYSEFMLNIENNYISLFS